MKLIKKIVRYFRKFKAKVIHKILYIIDRLDQNIVPFVNMDISGDLLYKPNQLIKTSLPKIDLSLVTYNSEKWIKPFFESYKNLNYNLENINIHIHDNGSQDTTIDLIKEFIVEDKIFGSPVQISTSGNIGFGAGHNRNAQRSKSDFIWICNLDIEFIDKSLLQLVSFALQDSTQAAAWEFRQTPYEHPKVYNPTTFETNWNSHACILIRKSAFDQIGGYDENIFMYGEDVDFSYRLRDKNYILRYCSFAPVIHHSYASENEFKLTQFYGGIFATIYLRLKFGSLNNILKIPFIFIFLFYKKNHETVKKIEIIKLIFKALSKTKSIYQYRKTHLSGKSIHFFSNWDYSIHRRGAFVKVAPIISNDVPLLTVITRTCPGRDFLLKESLCSVLNQTYPNIEIIISEDGDCKISDLIDSYKQKTSFSIVNIKNNPQGRSFTGNQALKYARGEYCIFLDDDDLFFHDHLESLYLGLLSAPDSLASYSMAHEVKTNIRYKQKKYSEHSFSVPEFFNKEYDSKALLQYNYITIQSILFKKSLYIERGGFDLELDALEDWEMWARYSINNIFKFVPKSTSLYRVPCDKSLVKKREVHFKKFRPLAREKIHQSTLKYSYNK